MKTLLHLVMSIKNMFHKGYVQYKAAHRYLSLYTKADLDIQQKGILTTLVSGAMTKYINISFGNFYLADF